jgi:hypothetical protein
MLSLCLISAALLVSLAQSLESRAVSYELRQLFLQVSHREKEASVLIRSFYPDFPDYFYLSDGKRVELKVQNTDPLELSFFFLYNGYLGKGVVAIEQSSDFNRNDGEREEYLGPDAGFEAESEMD